MSKSNGGSGNTFKVATIALGVLVVAGIVVIAVMASQKSATDKKLNDSQQQAASLQAQVSSLQTNLKTTQDQLSAAQTKIGSLQTDLTTTTATANAKIDALNKDVSSKQSTIDSQAAQIKTMRYPRNFSTIDELTNWLQKNNIVTWDPLTLTAVQRVQMAFALEIKASRDGYLLPVVLPMFGNLDYMTNRAVVGDTVYEVRAWDSFAQVGGRVTPAVPSYPIPPDSGK